jgi:hypothetical protein
MNGDALFLHNVRAHANPQQQALIFQRRARRASDNCRRATAYSILPANAAGALQTLTGNAPASHQQSLEFTAAKIQRDLKQQCIIIDVCTIGK